jgi:group I intron endonuclease
LVGIYKISSPSGGVYIGQSVDIARRWRHHRTAKVKSIISASMHKHGHLSHEFEIIHELPHDVDPEVMNRYEDLYIDAYREVGAKSMNLYKSGGSGKRSPEVVARMSDWLKGRVVSDETRKKMSIANKGAKRTAEQRLRMSVACKGRKMSEQAKKKLSSSLKGIKRSPEHQAKLNASISAVKRTPEYRKMMSDKTKEFYKRKREQAA